MKFAFRIWQNCHVTWHYLNNLFWDFFLVVYHFYVEYIWHIISSETKTKVFLLSDYKSWTRKCRTASVNSLVINRQWNVGLESGEMSRWGRWDTCASEHWFVMWPNIWKCTAYPAVCRWEKHKRKAVRLFSYLFLLEKLFLFSMSKQICSALKSYSAVQKSKTKVLKKCSTNVMT